MRDRFFLEEIVEQAGKAARYAAEDDEVHLLAMLKAMENVYEATTGLSRQARSALFPDPEEHRGLRAMRNFYVHQYHRVDEAMARGTARRDLPRIAERAAALLAGGDAWTRA